MFQSRFKRNDNEADFIYEHFRHEDFVEHALVITTDENQNIKRLHFNSCELGTLNVGRDGSISCHRWETEDEAQQASPTSRHFTTIGGVASEDRALANAILQDVLKHMKAPGISRYVRKFYDSPGTEVQIPLQYRPQENRRDVANPPGALTERDPPPRAAKPKPTDAASRQAPLRHSDYQEDAPEGFRGLRNPDLMFAWMLLAVAVLLLIAFC